MNCFPCFQSQKSKKANKNLELAISVQDPIRSSETKSQRPGIEDKVHEVTMHPSTAPQPQKPADEGENINAQTFTFRELASATKNFRQECLLGEGGFGRVYKGTLQSNGQVVAVKQLDRNGMQGNTEFLVEVLMLSLLHHRNLVKLIGYCADGDQRLLVYEFMAGGSVEDHILASTEEKGTLDWMTRMKIAYGAAHGLEYLHDKANSPVIYRDLKSSNILLDENLEPKLSDVGLAKLGLLGEKMQGPSRVMGTYGYSAPEYTRSGEFTIKSDVYSFGVVLLELITGRRVVDTTRPVDEQNLIAWAQPIFRDPKRFPDMADPLLRKRFPERSLNQAVAIAAMCLQEEPGARPLMSDAVTALGFLAKSTEPIPDSMPLPEEKSDDEDGSDYNDDDEEDDSNCNDDEDGDDDGESEEQEEGESSAQESENESNSGIKNGSSRSVEKIRKSGMKSYNETTYSGAGAPRKKKSQKLRSSSTHKTRKKPNEEGSSSSQQKRSKSLASSNRKGSRKSKMGTASSSRNSNKISAEGSTFPTENITRESPDE